VVQGENTIFQAHTGKRPAYGINLISAITAIPLREKWMAVMAEWVDAII